MNGPRIVVLDIETAPALADVWSLWNVNVGLSQLRQVSTVICFAAKWHGQRRVEFYSDHHNGHGEMVKQAHRILGEADVVVHYNGAKFDMPHLRREFLLAELPPHKPVQEVDLLRVAKGRFRFQSNKLDHVAQQLGVGSKVKHAGHVLWVACMAGDDGAWAQMRRYNKADVVLTEKVYDRLKPWIHNHPHAGLYAELDPLTCGLPGCGGKLQRRGFKATAISTYQQYQCQACGAWSRGKTAIARVDERGTA